MNKTIFLIVCCLFLNLSAQPAVAVNAGTDSPAIETFWERLQANIKRHLHRPYVWGSSGLKSFDCSGFVWRVMNDSGILIKRTTARKLYMSLPSVEKDQKYRPGNIVFFDNLKHCGIVSEGQTFYHARTSAGTTRDGFDHYWSPKVSGFRAVQVSDIVKQ